MPEEEKAEGEEGAPTGDDAYVAERKAKKEADAAPKKKKGFMGFGGNSAC